MRSMRFDFRGVSKEYNEVGALREVSFSLTSGEHTAIIGPSGCGKSTCLRLLAGLEAPSAGEIYMDGELVSGPERVLTSPHRRNLAMVFQDLALWPNLSVRDNVLLGLAAQSLTKDEARARARQALALCGIELLAERRPGLLSGGQQQRVALARAIAVRPAFLLLDEPFSGLDLVIKSGLMEEITRLAAEQDLTLVLVSHDPMEASALCRFAVVLEEGRAVESGHLADLLQAPRSRSLQIFRDHLRGFAFRP